jgi:acetyl esterase/lipase
MHPAGHRPCSRWLACLVLVGVGCGQDLHPAGTGADGAGGEDVGRPADGAATADSGASSDAARVDAAGAAVDGGAGDGGTARCSGGAPVIVVACGNAFGPCTSEDEVTQMAQVVAGLGIPIVRHDWGGTKWPQARMQAWNHLRQIGCRRIIFAGRSAGAWVAAISAADAPADVPAVAGVVSFYGPLDTPTLWQRDQWGKTNSPRGPIKYMMPWGLPGCTNCNDPFPAGDAWYWNVNDENDPTNDPHMVEAAGASPYHYLDNTSPPLFLTQGSEDGIIGQYGGVSQARRMWRKLGGRTQDQLVECSGYPHGYGFNAPCTRTALRQWICDTLGLQGC